jgi:carbonic anhydrase
MRKLIHGIVDFRKNVRDSYKDTFARLALGQRPDTLFIACSDSRVVPNLFASSDPGDLFVIRNVGNLIPPCGELGHSASDESEAAAIEFALLKLPVTEIIVCGHSECGAMVSLGNGRGTVEPSNLRSWLRHGEVSLQRMMAGNGLGEHLEPHNQLSQLNVLEQLEHLRTYPLVADRIQAGQLRLHAWWFDIKEAEVYEYDPSEGRFRLIDEEFASRLLLPSVPVQGRELAQSDKG